MKYSAYKLSLWTHKLCLHNPIITMEQRSQNPGQNEWQKLQSPIHVSIELLISMQLAAAVAVSLADLQQAVATWRSQ